MPFVTEKMQNPQESKFDWNKLTSVEENELETAWAQAFLNPHVVKQVLAEVQPQDLGAILTAGMTWRGTTWTTSRAALKIRQMTGMALVANNLHDYLHPFLASLGLAGGVDTALVDLDDRAAEIAFRLAEVWQGSDGQKEAPTAKKPAAEPEEEGEEEELPRFSWEPEQVPLPGDLSLVLQKLRSGEKLEARKLLEELPVFRGLKIKAEDNNHKLDSKSQHDRLLKGLQQRCINTMRGYAAIHSLLDQSDPEVQAVSQQLFWYMAETEQQILKERKKNSIPFTAQDNSNVLFSTEDLKVERNALNINRAGMDTISPQSQPHYFPIPKGSKPWKFRPQYRGKAFGGKSFNYKGFGGKSLGARSWGKGKANQAISTTHYFGKHRPVYCRHSGAAYGRHFVSHDCKQRKFTGSHPFTRKVASLFSLVEKTFTLPCSGPNLLWSAGRKNIAFKNEFVKTTKNIARNIFGSRSAKGLPKKWSSQITTPTGNTDLQTPHSMVHFVQGRKWKEKTSVDLRLSTTKQFFPSQEIQIRSPPQHLSLLKKRLLGSQVGLKGCLFSHPPSQKFATLHQTAGGGGTLGIHRFMFWHKHLASKIYDHNESNGKKMEIERNTMFCIPGRHTSGGQHPPSSAKTSSIDGARPFGQWLQNKCFKVNFRTYPKSSTFGLHFKFSGRPIASTTRQIEKFEEGVGKITDSNKNVLQEIGSHFGDHKKLPHLHPFFKSIYRHSGAICQPPTKIWLGSSKYDTSKSEGSNSFGKGSFAQLVRKTILHPSSKGNSLRLFHPGVGGV